MKPTHVASFLLTTIAGVSCMHNASDTSSDKAFPYAPVSDPATRTAYEAFMAAPDMPDVSSLLLYDWTCNLFDFANDNWNVANYDLKFDSNGSSSTVTFPAITPTAGTSTLYEHAQPLFRAARMQVPNSSAFKDAIFRLGKTVGSERPTLRIAHTTTDVASSGTYVLFYPDILNYQVIAISECAPKNIRSKLSINQYKLRYKSSVTNCKETITNKLGPNANPRDTTDTGTTNEAFLLFDGNETLAQQIRQIGCVLSVNKI